MFRYVAWRVLSILDDNNYCKETFDKWSNFCWEGSRTPLISMIVKETDLQKVDANAVEIQMVSVRWLLEVLLVVYLKFVSNRNLMYKNCYAWCQDCTALIKVPVKRFWFEWNNDYYSLQQQAVPIEAVFAIL